MKKMLLRVFCLMLCVLMLVPLASCNGETPNNSDNNTPGNTDNPGNTGNPGNPGNTENPDNPGDTETPVEPPVDTREEVNMDTLIERLTASKYSSNIKTSEFVGLTDPSLVGINEATVNDILYPIPADNKCDIVVNVKDYGVTPEAEDCVLAFRDVIKAVKGKEGTKKIVFPEGTYRFKQTLKFEDLENVYICSEGNDKYFSLLMTQWTPGINVTDCKNIHFNNFSLDYETPSVITGSVVRQSGNQIVVKVDEGYDLTHKNYNGGKVNYGSYMEFMYDEVTGQYVPNGNGNLLYNSTGDPWNNAMNNGTYDAATRELTLTFKDGRVKSVAAGVKVNVAYTMYENFGFHATGGENVYVEGVTFYHTLGMAIGMGGTNNVYLNRFKLTPKEGRLMTATADGFHCGSCTGEIIVTNSVFEYSHDDSFNIKGAYGKAVSATPKLLSYDKSKAISVKAGDVIDLYGASDFKYLGSWTVVEVNEAKATYKTKEIIDVDVTDAYIANDTQINSLTVRNSYFGNKRNRGMLIQCRDIVIEGCTFQNIIHGVLNIFSVADSFAEGIMPRNVVVRNNKFFHNSSSDVNVFTSGPSGAVSNTITGVEVYNNFFWQSQGRPITFKSAGSSKATDNFIYEFRSSLDSAIYVYISENIEISKNYIKGPISNADFEAVKVDGSSTTNIENKRNMQDVYKAT